MISSLLFINIKGEIIIYREYKSDISRKEVQQFCNKIVARKENKENPVVLMDNTSFIHLQQNDIILLACTKQNVNISQTFHFLQNLIDIITYFISSFKESSIKKEISLIYEILDEVMDFGIPQITNLDVLKQIISHEIQTDDVQSLKQLTNQATGNNSRAPNIIHKKNEVYIDLIENLNILISNKGSILQSEIIGVINMKTKLSGMPECQLGINDKISFQDDGKGIEIEDVKFHSCVRLNQYNQNKTITFVPPDGDFELMKYRVSKNISIPFKIVPIITLKPNHIEYNIKLKSIYDFQKIGTNIIIKVPVPNNTSQVFTNESIGKAKLDTKDSVVAWKIPKLYGDKDCVLRMQIKTGRSKDNMNWKNNPIAVNFSIQGFSSSGITIRYLKVIEKSGYKPTKWIRKICRDKEFIVRMNIN